MKIAATWAFGVMEWRVNSEIARLAPGGGTRFLYASVSELVELGT